MQQLLISILMRDEPDSTVIPELHSRAIAMGLGQQLLQSGMPVHMVTAATSPIAVDPRSLGLKDILGNLSPEELEQLKTTFPMVWFAVSMMVEGNEEQSCATPSTGSAGS